MFRIEMDDEHLRDFYAGLAMLGLVTVYRDDPSVMTACVERAFDISEAMMQERSKRDGQKNGGDGQSV
jgi:hypothetical protein